MNRTRAHSSTSLVAVLWAAVILAALLGIASSALMLDPGMASSSSRALVQATTSFAALSAVCLYAASRFDPRLRAARRQRS